MSLESDMEKVRSVYPSAHCQPYTSTGGSKILSYVIRDGTADALKVGPSAFNETNAWRFACQRIEVANGKAE